MNKIYVKIIAALFLLLPFEAAGAVLELTDVPPSADLAPFIGIYEDRSGDMDIGRIAADPALFSFPGTARNLGYTRSAWWISITVRNATARQLSYLLRYNQTWTSRVDFYYPQGTGFNVIKTGTSTPVTTRPYNDRAFVFPVKQDPGEQTYYFRIQGKNRVVLDFSLWSPDGFSEKRFSRESLYRASYAILIAFLVYNILLLLMVRIHYYIFYCLYLLGYILFLCAYDGTGYMYLWTNRSWWDNLSLGILIPLHCIPFIYFFLFLTDARRYIPRLSRFLVYLSVVMGFMAFMAAVLPERPVLRFAIPVVQIAELIIISGSIVLIRMGSRPAIYFLVTFGVQLLSSLGVMMSASRFIQPYSISLVLHGGGVFSAVMFSLAMAERINSIRLEKIEAEKQLAIRNVSLTHANESLEATNEELQAAMEELEATNEEMVNVLDELRDSNQKLWKSEQRLSTLFELAPVGISLLDVNGNLEQTNPYTLEMLGYRMDEMLGGNVMEITYQEDRDENEKMLLELLSRKIRSYAIEKRYIRKDGTLCWVYVVTSALYDETGKFTGFIGVAMDISKRKQAEEEREKAETQLRHAQKLEAVGTLAGGIAHDFNNILTAIIGYTELAVSDDSTGESACNYLKNVMTASGRAKDLVKQLLTISRQTEQERKPVAIGEAVEETLRLMRATIPSTIEIKVEPGAENDVVLADMVQIQQVVLNLCSNAGQAMASAGGTLKLSTADREIDGVLASSYGLPSPGRYLELTVADTGTGMPPDILERIFNPFFTTKARGQGTGLGLSVTLGIVRDHGGNITVDSEPGSGSVFHVYLPLTSLEVRRECQVTELPPSGTERILVVDDETAIAEMNRHILEKLGYRVVVTSDSMYAMELFSSAPGDFDCLVTDQTMPGLTGFELAERILSIRPGFPVVLCTGYSETIDSEKAGSAGIREFLYKPVPSMELAKALRRALDGK